MAFIESYQQNLNKTKLLSKIASFLIAIILLIEVFSNLIDLPFSEFEWTEAWVSLLKTLSLQTVVGIIFSIRFILLFLNKSTSLLFSQIIWLVAWLSALIYLAAMGIFNQNDSHIHYQLSVNKTLFATIPYFYLFLSPIRQISTLVFSYFSRK